MKKHTRRFIFVLVLVCIAAVPAIAAGKNHVVRMDILFMNHGPMQPTIRQLKAIINKQPDLIQAHWYDYEEPSGRQFMKANNIQGHIPLLILINGSATHQVLGRKITFMGFPSGAGPYQFQGKWSMKDLEALIQSISSSNK